MEMEMETETSDGIMEAKPRAEKGGSGKGGRAVDQALAEAAAKAIWSGPLLVKAAVALTQGKGRAVAGSKASAFRSFEPWNEFHRIFLELRFEIQVWILLPLLNSWPGIFSQKLRGDGKWLCVRTIRIRWQRSAAQTKTKRWKIFPVRLKKRELG